MIIIHFYSRFLSTFLIIFWNQIIQGNKIKVKLHNGTYLPAFKAHTWMEAYIVQNTRISKAER